MKFIIIGLGTLGYSMARILTEQGEDVIGIDSNLSKVEQYKNDISSTICMNVKEYHPLSSLPIKDVDAVIVAIGNDMSTSIEVVAYLKQLGAKKIYARSNSPVETAILQAIGIDKIMNPSEYASEIYVFDIRATSGIEGMYQLDNTYRIYEVIIPSIFIGQEINAVNFEENFKMKLVTIKRKTQYKNIFGKEVSGYQIIPDILPDMVFQEEDELVLFGTAKNFAQMKKTLS
ncbi:MAG: TrkA family potassium uptake protein [Bacteroidales bacterium]